MTIRPILSWPDPLLSTACAPVGAITPYLRQLATDMLETMYDAPGRGLAAPQIGVLSRIFVMDTTWREGTYTPLAFFDPQITWMSSHLRSGPEGCLSIPGITVTVTRARELDLAWTDINGAAQTLRFDGAAATCIQHEMDHLDGRVTFDRLEPEARAEALRAYSEEPST